MSESSKFASTWMLAEVLHALYKNGILATLEKSDVFRSSVEVSKQCGTKERETEAMLLFVSVMFPELLERNKDGLYRRGPDLMSRRFQNTLHFSLAYAPVAHALSPLVSGEKEYGHDVCRDGVELGISSELYARDIAEDITTLVGGEKPDVVIDLGCGSGHIVRRIASECSCVGIGIDESMPESTEKEDGNLFFVKGDISDPTLWKENVPAGKTVFVASMVMHEFLFDGSDKLKELFGEYRTCFPNAVMFVAEYNGYTPDELVALPTEVRGSAALYQFVHPLTKQGTPRGQKEWRQIFKKCDVELLGEFISKPNATIYKVRW